MTNFLSHDDAVTTFIDYDEVERRDDAAAAGYLEGPRVIFNGVLISAFPATIDERASFVVPPGCIFQDGLLLLHFRRLFLHVIFKHGVLGGRCYWDPWSYLPFYLASSNRLVVIVCVCSPGFFSPDVSLCLLRNSISSPLSTV